MATNNNVSQHSPSTSSPRSTSAGPVLSVSQSTEKLQPRNEAATSSSEKTEAAAATEQKPQRPTPPPGLDHTWMAWLQCAGSFVAWFVCMGLVNAFGAWQDFYTRSYLSESASQISWIGSLQGCFLFIPTLITGPLFDRGYVRALLFVGSFLTVFGMFMTSLCTEYWQLLLAQGLVVGTGMNCVYVPGIAVLPAYFTKHRALALAIAVSGSSVGGIVYSITFRLLEPKIGFGWATRIIAFMTLGLLAIPTVGLKQRTKPKAVRKVFDPEAWTSSSYTVLCVGQFFGRIAFYIPYFYIPLYAAVNGLATGGLQVYLITLINGGSLVGRVILGAAGDRFGPLNTLIVSFAITGVIVFTWISVYDTAGIVIISVLYGFFSGGYMSLGPTVVVNICPDLSKLGTYMGMLSVTLAVGVLIGPPIAGALLDHGYVALQAFCGAMVFACVACCIAVKIMRIGFQPFSKI